MTKPSKHILAMTFASLLLCSNLHAIMVTTTNLSLIQGIRQNNAEQVSQAIVSHGNEIVNNCIGSGISPLHIAAALDEAEITLILLNSGAHIDAKTDGGFTALHWAAGKNAEETTTILLRHGADIEAKTFAGITPLHWAANNNSTNVIKLLLVSGAKPLPKTVSGKTPLHLAISKRSIIGEVFIPFQMKISGLHSRVFKNIRSITIMIHDNVGNDFNIKLMRFIYHVTQRAARTITSSQRTTLRDVANIETVIKTVTNIAPLGS